MLALPSPSRRQRRLQELHALHRALGRAQAQQAQQAQQQQQQQQQHRQPHSQQQAQQWQASLPGVAPRVQGEGEGEVRRGAAVGTASSLAVAWVGRACLAVGLGLLLASP